MVRYILFDFDGTLADSKAVFLTIFNQLAGKYNCKQLGLEDLDELRKLPLKERSRRLNFPMYKLPFFVMEVYGLYRKALHEVSLFEGISQMLEELKSRGYKLAIMSSNSELNIQAILQRHHVTSIDEVICSRHIFGKDKMLKSFLKKYRLAASEVLYIGDEHRDVVACKKSCVKIIWVSWGYDAPEVVQAANPDYSVHSPAEVLHLLQPGFVLRKCKGNWR